MQTPEPSEAFHYKPPDDFIKEKYFHIFKLEAPLKERLAKCSFDKLLAVSVLFITSPLLLILKTIYMIEGMLVPENKGPMFFYYNAVSAGEIFPKYKIRIIKMKYIEKTLE